MRTLRLIVEREFKSRMGKKGFWFFTLFGLVLMVLMAFLPSIMHWMESRSMPKLAVYDPGQIVAPALTENQTSGASALPFRIVMADSHQHLESASAAQAYLNSIGASALVVVSGSSPADVSFAIKEAKSVDPSDLAALEGSLRNLVVQERIARLDPTVKSALVAPIPFSVQSIAPDTKSTDELFQAKMLVYFMEILLMTTIIVYGAWVAQGVIEEKSSRIVEVLLVAAKPWQILFGKVLGVAAAGLVQYAIWTTAVIGALAARQSLDIIRVGSVSPLTLVFFPVFFILGYLLYATLFAIGGSLVYRAEDQQVAVTPVTLLMVAAFYVAMAVLVNPDSAFATIVSLIPLCAPLAMFSRVALTAVPVWQLILSLVLLGGTIWGLVRVGERIYRSHILRTSGAYGWKLLMAKGTREPGVEASQ